MTVVRQETGAQKAPSHLEEAKRHEIGAKRDAQIDHPARPLEFRRNLVAVELIDVDRTQRSDDPGEQCPAQEREHNDRPARRRIKSIDQHVNPDVDAGPDAKRGAELRLALTRMVPGYELLKEVRGKGLMIGVEFGPPKSLRLKASWNVLETANKGLFCQLITVPLFKDHKILTQVSGHGSHTIKLLPPLCITEEDCSWIEKAFDSVIASSHKVPGAIWSLGKTLVDNAVRKSA